MKITIKSKKGISGVTLGLLVTAIVVIVFGVLWLTMSSAGAKGIGKVTTQALDGLGDCDNDKYVNNFQTEYGDKCPCIPSGNVVSEEFPGCPKGTDVATVSHDQQTCHWYVNSINEDKPFATAAECKESEICIEKPGGGYLRRCDQVKATALPSQGKTAKGESTYGDLVVTLISPTEKMIEDLGNTQDKHTVTIKATVKNIGTESISNSFSVAALVCDTKKEQCQEKESKRIDIELVPSSEQKNTSTAKNQEPVEFTIDIGTDGDWCDGPNRKECEVVVMVDSNQEYAEANEKNNRAGVRVILKNQKFEQYGFWSYKSISLFADDDDSGIFEIRDPCQGYIGSDGENDCPAEGACDGDLFEDDSKLMSASGCWVGIEEDDSTDPDDCAYVVANPGARITVLGEGSEIDWNRAAGVDGPESDGDPLVLLGPRFKWKTNPSYGSLLCSNTAEGYKGKGEYWEACGKDPNDEGKIVVLLDGREFVCQNKQWVAR